ncbi:MAG: acyltransferase family protein [Candidatus Latescibacterota bacterium]
MEKPQFSSNRIVSIDALRGFDMFWIVGGGTLVSAILTRIGNPLCQALNQQLEHCLWHGFHFEDLIHPLFLFLVGASMPFSLSKRIARGDSRRDLYIHIFQRTIILYLLGMVYNGLLDFQFDNLRYTGVLHRIAFTYLFAALIVMNFSIRGQVIWAGVLLVGYWAAMSLVPVPGVGTRSLEPNANLADFIDSILLPGAHRSYGLNKGGDANGILTTVPAIVSVLIGVLAGHRLRSNASPSRKALESLAAGIALLLISLLWNIVFPINKLLWTSSYVLFTGGWSLLLFAGSYWIIDVREYRAWAFPFVVIGMNAITIYMASRLFNFRMIARPLVGGVARFSGSYQEIVWAASALATELLLLYFLYRRKLFLKV